MKGGNSLPLKSVVKFHVSRVDVDYDSPWRRKDETKVTGTGFAIEGRFLVTNDHVIHESNYVRVTKPGCATKFKARVVCNAREADLALVEVESDEFWHNLPMLSLTGILPHLGTHVVVVGYPTGGAGLSITRGVVSRVTLNNYHTACSHLLTIQIDAAINPGNSGGPVFDENNEVIGVARSVRRHSQNIGYIIAGEVVKMVIDQYKTQKKFLGLSNLSFRYQTLESESQRKRLKLNKAVGVRVCETSPVGPVHGLIEKDDVITEIDGIEIANDASIRLSEVRPNERINFAYAIISRPVGSVSTLKVMRSGEERTIECTLRPARNLVPVLHLVDCLPRHIIVGGLVFVPLTRPWFSKTKHANTAEICALMDEYPSFDGEEIVVMTKMLSAHVNFGYTHLSTKKVLLSLNGVKIRSLEHFASLIDNCSDEFYIFEFRHSEIVLEREKCIKTEKQMLQRHSISVSRILDNVVVKSTL